MSDALDRRLHAFRDDLADAKLEGSIKAYRYVEGDIKTVKSAAVDLRPKPDLSVGIDTQLLFGDVVRVFDEKDDWAWVQAARDGYVGYMQADHLGELDAEPAHRIRVPRSFVYAEPDMKRPVQYALSMGSAVTVVGGTETRGTRYAELADGGFVVDRHLNTIDVFEDDYVAVAETLLNAPYLWGGSTAFGVDCSGLVQLALLMTGQKVLRDSDMQERSVGQELGFAAMDGGLKRGDLVFWKGHVGIMRSGEELIHANGHTMTVALEKLEDAIERIGYLYGFPRTLRRVYPD